MPKRLNRPLRHTVGARYIIFLRRLAWSFNTFTSGTPCVAFSRRHNLTVLFESGRHPEISPPAPPIACSSMGELALPAQTVSRRPRLRVGATSLAGWYFMVIVGLPIGCADMAFRTGMTKPCVRKRSKLLSTCLLGFVYARETWFRILRFVGF